MAFHPALPVAVATVVMVVVMALYAGALAASMGALVALLAWATGVLHERYVGGRWRHP